MSNGKFINSSKGIPEAANNPEFQYDNNELIPEHDGSDWGKNVDLDELRKGGAGELLIRDSVFRRTMGLNLDIRGIPNAFKYMSKDNPGGIFNQSGFTEYDVAMNGTGLLTDVVCNKR